MTKAQPRQDLRGETPPVQQYGVVTEPGTVRLERLLPGPIERLWSYLTDSGKRGKWFATGNMEPRAGGRVELHFEHATLSDVSEQVPDKYKGKEVSDFTGRITQGIRRACSPTPGAKARSASSSRRAARTCSWW